MVYCCVFVWFSKAIVVLLNSVNRFACVTGAFCAVRWGLTFCVPSFMKRKEIWDFAITELFVCVAV